LQEIKRYYTRFLQLIVGNIRYLSIYINWLIVFMGWLVKEKDNSDRTIFTKKLIK
jgi:hypothetical protein